MRRKKTCPTAAREVGKAMFFLCWAVFLVLPAAVYAGPPFVTDDPATMPIHTGELYLFATGTRAVDGDTLDAGPGFELNYSFVQNTFLHLVIPLTYIHPSEGQKAYGLGDVELGFKWRFMDQEHSLLDIATFPIVVIPTGDEGRGLGNGQPQIFLPLWIGKDWEPWSAYGGGGYWINPGEGNRNWWFVGIQLQRQISDKLYLGAELFHQTADTEGGQPSTGFNIGGGLNVGGPYQILFSTGRNIENPDDNRFSFYVALYRTF